jgi:O-antigen/teichoic acid export membrane protein
MRGIVSLALRLAAVGGKFFAVVALANFAEPRDVGAFGVFLGAVNILVFVISLDFHQFVIREILSKRDKASRLQVMLGQAVLNSSIYLLIGICLIPATSHPALEGFSADAGWFVAILITDHASQELSRLFLVQRRPFVANVIYALKTGIWGWIGALSLYAGWADPTAQTFYVFWLLSNVAAVLTGLILLQVDFREIHPLLPQGLLRWTANGLKVSARFYLASVAMMVMAYSDRLIIATSTSLSEAGQYTFWQSISALLPVAVYAAAGMHFLPRLVEAYQRGRSRTFARLRDLFVRRTILISGLSAAFILLGYPMIPFLVGKSEFQAGILTVSMLIAGAALNALWQVPYQVLYSAHDDHFLTKILTATTAGSIILNLMAVPFLGIAGAALITVISNATVLLLLDKRSRRFHGPRPHDENLIAI